MQAKSMNPHVVVVTGASRGLGRGMARAFGRSGFTVFITGRTGASLETVAAEITAAGGRGIAVPCDHQDDDQVRRLFERVRNDCGRLDVLVNNATIVHVQDLASPGGFWQKPLHLVDMVDVGLRSSYVASYYAAPLMIETGGALMAHISFYGAVSYHYGPAYGAAKAGTDKMSFDMALELRPHGVTSVSIWPGYVLTEMLQAIPADRLPAALADRLPHFETPDFTGVIEAATGERLRSLPLSRHGYRVE